MTTNAALPSPLFWRYPVTEPTVDDEWAVQSGWELVFKTTDGLPVHVGVMNIPYDMKDRFTGGVPRFVKEPPVVELAVKQYRCPFADGFSMRDQFRRRGFAPCRFNEFANVAAMSRHVREGHPSESNDLRDTGLYEQVLQQVIDDAEREQEARRALDPRLRPAEASLRPIED